MILAYAYGLRTPLITGLVLLEAFIAAEILLVSGSAWYNLPSRPENFMLGGALILLLPPVILGRHPPGFPVLYRMLGLAGLLIPTLVLSQNGDLSHLRRWADTVQTCYMLFGFAAGAVAIWFGLARRLKDLVYGGSFFLAVFLYAQYLEWWWDWMPKYLFFLIVAATAVAAVSVMKRLRWAMGAADDGAGQ